MGRINGDPLHIVQVPHNLNTHNEQLVIYWTSKLQNTNWIHLTLTLIIFICTQSTAGSVSSILFKSCKRSLLWVYDNLNFGSNQAKEYALLWELSQGLQACASGCVRGVIRP